MPGSMARPLEGLRVLDLTNNLPGPLATLMLADLGATVIKVEPPEGDPVRNEGEAVSGASLLFHALNRGKMSVCLDLKDPAQCSLLRRLASECDMLIEGFRPGVLERLGLDPQELTRSFPRLFVVRLSGYGQRTSLSRTAGHDLNFLALSGSLSGFPPPNPPPFQAADVTAALLCVAKVLAACLVPSPETLPCDDRVIDLAILDAAALLAFPRQARDVAGQDTAPGRGLLEGGLPTYRLYGLADGAVVAVAALEPRHAGEVLSRLNLSEASALQEALLRLELKDIQAMDLPCVAPVLSPSEARKQGLLSQRGAFRPMSVPGAGVFLLPVTPFTEGVPDGPWAADLGAHNSVLL